MKALTFSLIFALVLGATLATCAVAEPVSFRNDIARVLLDNCVACHGEKKAEGGYRVDTFELLVGEGDSGIPGFVAADLEESEAFRRIVSEDVDERMPLEGDPLMPEFIALLKQWIEEGAKIGDVDPKAPLASYAPLFQQAAPEQYLQTVPITALQYSTDGNELFVGGYYELTVWNANDGKLLRRIPGASQRTMAINLSADGKTLAVGGGTPGKSGTVRLFDAETGKLKKTFAPTADMVLDLQFSPDGSKLAVGTAESLLLVYDATSGEKLKTIAGHSDWVTAVAWSPDGKHIASGSRDSTAKVYDAESGEIVITYSSHGKAVRGIAYHPEGAEVFSAGADNKIHRWKAADGKKQAEIVFGSEVYKLPLVGAYLFAASADKTVRQVDAKTFAEVRQFTGHEDWAISVAIHEATGRVASGSFDGEVKIWNAEDGAPVGQFIAAPGYQPSN